MGIEQRDTVEASAACGQFPFLSYHIICDKKDLAPPESFSRNYLPALLFLLLTGIQDSDPLAAVAKDSDTLETFLISVHVKVLRLLHRKPFRHVHCRADRRVNMVLPH